MYETINQEVNVLAHFVNGKIVPLKLIWKNKKIDLKTLNFVHSSKDGTTKLIHFATSNDSENYKLTYNTKSNIWTLNEIYIELGRVHA